MLQMATIRVFNTSHPELDINNIKTKQKFVASTLYTIHIQHLRIV